MLRWICDLSAYLSLLDLRAPGVGGMSIRLAWWLRVQREGREK